MFTETLQQDDAVVGLVCAGKLWRCWQMSRT